MKVISITIVNIAPHLQHTRAQILFVNSFTSALIPAMKKCNRSAADHLTILNPEPSTLIHPQIQHHPPHTGTISPLCSVDDVQAVCDRYNRTTAAAGNTAIIADDY